LSKPGPTRQEIVAKYASASVFLGTEATLAGHGQLRAKPVGGLGLCAGQHKELLDRLVTGGAGHHAGRIAVTAGREEDQGSRLVD